MSRVQAGGGSDREDSAGEIPALRIDPALAPWLNAGTTSTLMAALADDGFETRVVGGVVRDHLLGRRVHDVDLATTALPHNIIETVRRRGFTAIPTGIAHGTVTVVANGVPFEVTTLRRDVTTDGRHAEVAFTNDWRDDAGRRDFTINALSCSAAGDVYDYYGGLADLGACRVRFIGEARARIQEDFLRILRFFRFSADYAGGHLDIEGFDAAVSEADGLARLSAERVRAELMRLLSARYAADVVQAMEIAGFWQRIIGCSASIEQFTKLTRLEEALKRPPDVLLRLAVLSSSCDQKMLSQRLRLPAAEAADLMALAAPPEGLAPSGSEMAAKHAIYDVGAEAYVRAVLALWAASGDDPGSASWFERLMLASRWTRPSLPVRGADILAFGVPPGPAVGEILAEIEAWWRAAGFPDDMNLIRKMTIKFVGQRI